MRAWGVLLAVTLVPLAAMIAGAPGAHAQDLKTNTDSTTKTGGDVPKPKDLSTGAGTELAPQPKPFVPKPKPSASASESASASASADASAEPAPSTSASVVSAAPQPFARRTVPLGLGDFSVAVGAPGNWPEIKDEELPNVDTAAAPEATVTVKRGFGWNKPEAKTPHVAEVVVVCAKASADYWGDSIRDAVFTSLTAAVEKEAQQYSDLKALELDPVRHEGDRIVQPFHGTASFTRDGEKADLAPAGAQKGQKNKGGATVTLQGVSFIGFKAEAGDARTLLACTVTCAHLTGEGDKSVCSDVVQSLEVSGTFATAPKRSWVADLLYGFKKDKTTGLLILVGVAVGLALVVVLLLALLRKKKPEPANATSGGLDAVEDEDFRAGYEAGLAAARASGSAPGSPSAGGHPSAVAPSSTSGGASDLHAPAPPPDGYVDPTTLQPRG